MSSLSDSATADSSGHSNPPPPHNQAPVLDAWKGFFGAEDLQPIIQSFKLLQQRCSQEAKKTDSTNPNTPQPANVYDQIKEIVSTNYQTRRWWNLIDKRRRAAVYEGQTGRGKQVVVVGAGPAGLRLAIECCLLGAKTVVLEKRDSFNRWNVLHIWDHACQDLISLGKHPDNPLTHSTLSPSNNPLTTLQLPY